MEFEFDPNKSADNYAKQGLDFIDAQRVWEDEMMIQIPAARLCEDRFLVIGRLNNRILSVVITYRGRSIRIISARRARRDEEDLYEGV